MKQGQVVDLTEDIAINAGKISVELKIPLADSIIYATAKKYNAKIYSQDNDFRKLENVIIIEALAKVLKNGSFVIPTKVGIQSFQLLMNFLDSRFHGNDDFCKRLY